MTQRKVVTAFLAAARTGDFDALVAVLDPDVVLHTDAGERPPARRTPALIAGAAEVARHAAARGPRFARLCRLALVNGAAGVVARTPGGLVAVAAMRVVDGRIVTIDLLLDPDRLRELDLSG